MLSEIQVVDVETDDHSSSISRSAKRGGISGPAVFAACSLMTFSTVLALTRKHARDIPDAGAVQSHRPNQLPQEGHIAAIAIGEVN